LINSFGDAATEDIFHGRDSKAARRIAKALWPRIRMKLDLLNAATDLQDLRVPPGNRLEALRGRLAGYHSIRVNQQYRIVFQFASGNCRNVSCADYH